MRDRESLMKDAEISKSYFNGSVLETMLDIRDLLAKPSEKKNPAEKDLREDSPGKGKGVNMSIELVIAKRTLYSLLLEKDPDLWTDTEASLGFLLAQDRDIQTLLKRGKKLEQESAGKDNG